MESNKINKIIIPKDDLPPIEAGGIYHIRFRIKSEDNNMSSHWSWVYDVVSPVAKENILDGGEVI